ncbi:MAG: glycosyltransferase [Candidatus Cloacimonadaceae bacterium]|nr:glycosyltransferase [Candidatus Cloacimonadaceae bacterium]
MLFVCSGNDGVSPIIRAQAESLKRIGIDLEIIPVVGKGYHGYFRFIKILRKHIRKTKPDLIHAHYSFCGIIAALSSRKKVITSLMGSDVNQTGIWRFIIKIYIKFVWKKTIVKSEDMRKKIGIKNTIVIPNGVDIEKFKPMDKRKCREEIGWDQTKKIILFAGNPERPEKNYALARQSVLTIERDDVELKVVYGMKHSQIPLMLNAADLLLLTSKWEGSPNIVKEAMACNIPVVSTDVGDVRLLFGNVAGFNLVDHNMEEICKSISSLLKSEQINEGRAQIIKLKMDSVSIARRLLALYKDALAKKQIRYKEHE